MTTIHLTPAPYRAEGHAAFSQGIHLSENPYRHQMARTAWALGWADAHSDALEAAMSGAHHAC